jgi:hypothetical protein
MQFIREIGLNLFIIVGQITLGTRVMKELLIACRCTTPLKKSMHISYISFLMMGQHFLINIPLKPSGLGALSQDIVLTT